MVSDLTKCLKTSKNCIHYSSSGSVSLSNKMAFRKKMGTTKNFGHMSFLVVNTVSNISISFSFNRGLCLLLSRTIFDLATWCLVSVFMSH